jgi:S1-C subfamily serine protease
MAAASPRASAHRKTRSAPSSLIKVAREIAGEVSSAKSKRAQKTTLRKLLTRCGYEQRNTQTVRRISAALDAAGVQCLPPPVGVDDLDAPLQLAAAPPRKTAENSASKTAPASTARPRTKTFKSREEMLAHARLATVFIALADGHGSGFVIDKSGLVLTARHVVNDAEEVCLRFENGREDKGRVVFSDPALDYAFVLGQPCPDVLPLSPTADLAIGQTVYAIGTPLQSDLAGSVTRGIISGLDRVIGGVTYIQTDATIHAGHSGGPLLTERGELAGMNLWGRPEDGIRFALPVCYLAEALAFIKPQLSDLKARLYCADCGFLNDADSWILCASWLCCGHCGSLLGDLNAHEEESSACAVSEGQAIANDRNGNHNARQARS